MELRNSGEEATSHTKLTLVVVVVAGFFHGSEMLSNFNAI